MSLLSYKKVSIERDSEGEEAITLHFTSFRATGNPLDNEDAHQFTMSPERWLEIRNAVNKFLGER